jgi:hypothetical protein
VYLPLFITRDSFELIDSALFFYIHAAHEEHRRKYAFPRGSAPASRRSRGKADREIAYRLL